MGRKKGEDITTEGFGPAWPDFIDDTFTTRVKGSEPLFLHSSPNLSPIYFISFLGSLKETYIHFLGMWVESASLYHEHGEILGKLQFSHLKAASVKHNTTVKYATVPLPLLSLPLLP